eukprot:m.935956 g.935956  ORF g.935956 m.935956 type:complete len:67 (+) comp23807_c0_seq15:1646-1846(+)
MLLVQHEQFLVNNRQNNTAQVNHDRYHSCTRNTTGTRASMAARSSDAIHDENTPGCVVNSSYRLKL